MYYTVIKHDRHLRTRGKCGKHEQCNTRLRLLHLLYDVEALWRKTIKYPFSMFYTLIIHGFLTNQSAGSKI